MYDKASIFSPPVPLLNTVVHSPLVSNFYHNCQGYYNRITDRLLVRAVNDMLFILKNRTLPSMYSQVVLFARENGEQIEWFNVS